MRAGNITAHARPSHPTDSAFPKASHNRSTTDAAGIHGSPQAAVVGLTIAVVMDATGQDVLIVALLVFFVYKALKTDPTVTKK